MKLTDKLDLLMTEKNINKRELSIESGIPYMTIVNFYEKGTENIKLSTLKKLANYFNVSLDYIANDDVTERFSTAPPKDQPTDDPYANLSPKVAAELRRLDALGVTGEEPATIVAYNGLNINQTSPKAQAELDRIKKRDYQNAKEFVYEQIDDREKKAAVIGYDNGVKSEFFLDEQETRVVLNLIKSLREE